MLMFIYILNLQDWTYCLENLVSTDVEQFLTECRNKRKFQENGLKACRLEKSRSVQVENLPDQCNEDFLSLYFEKWAGPVEDIRAKADEHIAIVTFQDQKGKSFTNKCIYLFIDRKCIS